MYEKFESWTLLQVNVYMRPFIHSRPYFIYACKKYARVEIHPYLTFSAKVIKFSKNEDVAVNCFDKDDSDYVVSIPRWRTYRDSYFVNPRFLSIWNFNS